MRDSIVSVVAVLMIAFAAGAWVATVWTAQDASITAAHGRR